MKLVVRHNGNRIVETGAKEHRWYDVACLVCPRGPWTIYGPRGERFACAVCGTLLAEVPA